MLFLFAVASALFVISNSPDRPDKFGVLENRISVDMDVAKFALRIIGVPLNAVEFELVETPNFDRGAQRLDEDGNIIIASGFEILPLFSDWTLYVDPNYLEERNLEILEKKRRVIDAVILMGFITASPRSEQLQREVSSDKEILSKYLVDKKIININK